MNAREIHDCPRIAPKAEALKTTSPSNAKSLLFMLHIPSIEAVYIGFFPLSFT